MGALAAPVPLGTTHDLTGFDCGEPSLNQWLIGRADKNEKTGTSRTYVLTDDQHVIGYFSLSNGQVSRAVAPGPVSRNMPEPIPVIIMGRLAVHIDYQHRGLGSDLLRDAFLRARKASEISAARALLIHALNERAKQFYLHNGFFESPVDPLTLMHSLY
jgi:GNAT superfamily N-acetyltransferase